MQKMSLAILRKALIMWNDKRYILAENHPDYRTIESYYDEGFQGGYKWLTQGYNFKHPSARGGYIPGGPIVWQHRYEGNGAYQRSKAWANGWVDGINKYVTDNDLDYPIVERLYQ